MTAQQATVLISQAFDAISGEPALTNEDQEILARAQGALAEAHRLLLAYHTLPVAGEFELARRREKFDNPPEEEA